MSGWFVFDAQTWSAIAGIGALLTALVNFGQGRIAARSNTAEIYLEFTRRYNHREIPDAISALIRWYKENPSDFAQAYCKRLKEQDPSAIEINIQRRTLNRYFIDVVAAYESGVLKKAFAKLAADQPGASIWRHIVVPMNMEHYGRDCSRSLGVLVKLVPDFGKTPII